ncbi:hypothetical protein Trydic_g18235 [Trypoxylus dichotomus]
MLISINPISSPDSWNRKFETFFRKENTDKAEMDPLKTLLSNVINTMDILTIGFIGLFFLMVGYKPPWWSKNPNLSASPSCQIPGPPSLPILVHLFYRDMFKKYGPIIKEEALWNIPVISVVNRSDMEKVLKSSGKYPIRPPTEAIAYYRRSRPERYASAGVVNEQGEIWAHLRANLTKDVTSPHTISTFLPQIGDMSKDLCSLIRHFRQEDDKITQLEFLTRRLGLEAMCILILGRRMGFLLPEGETDIAKRLRIAVHHHFLACRDTYYGLPLWKLFHTPSYSHLIKSEESIYNLALELIRTADEETRKSLVFESILNANTDDREKTAAIVDFIASGIQTLGNTLVFLLSLISKRKDIQEEIATNENSEYIRACIKETFRLLPTANCLARVIEKDLELSGHNLKAGSVVVCQTGLACRDPNNFPNPDEFLPERWIGDEKSKTLSNSTFLLLPFGHGKRQCPGRSLSATKKPSKQGRAHWDFASTSLSSKEPASRKRRLNLTTLNDYNNSNASKKMNECAKDNLGDDSDDILESSFEVFDDTQTLLSRNNSTSTNSNCLSFTQLCSDTQVRNFINRSGTKMEKEGNSPDHCVNKVIKFKTDEDDVSGISQVFTTSQYRKDVEILFKKVEYSICELGPNQDQTLAKDAEDLVDTDAKFTANILSAMDWDDQSWLHEATLSQEENQKLGSVIKNALLKNAERNVSPGKVINQTLLETEIVYSELGDFYGLPKKVKDLLQMYRGIANLYDWQDECLNLPAIKEKKNLVYALPTSGGKTLVAEILILREILCWKRNALFILPYVAIVQEKVWALSPFAVALDFLVEEYAAGKGKFPPRKRRRKNSVYVATIEKALGLVNSLIDTERTGELGLVIVDELHLIGDESRGATLEELLSKLLCIQENTQIIGMSATIGNLPEICKFLNAEAYTRNFRPVELVEYVKCGDELAKINWNAKDEEDLLNFEKKCNFPYSEKLKKIDPDFLGGMVMEVVPNDSCLIFCSSKKNCENVAHLLCRVLPAHLKEIKTKEKDDLKQALELESGTLCNILKTSLLFGVAYHHSGLTADERRLIEDGFRAGTLNVICCTSTLAAGVNLPAKRVILRQPYIGKDFINLSRYKQMVGRAGRAGLGDSELLLSPMDEAVSSMHQNGAIGLRQLLLSLISLNIATTRVDLLRMAKKTLLAVQEARVGLELKRITDKAIVELFKLGAVKVDDDCSQESSSFAADVSVQINNSMSSPCRNNSETLIENKKPKMHISLNNQSKLVISKLGSAAIRGGLELAKAHLLYNDLLQAQESLVLLNCLHLLYLVTPYEMSEQVRPSKPRYYRIYAQLGKDELQTAKILGLTESIAIKLLNNQPIKTISDRVLNRFYVALMLYDLWNEVSIYQVAEKFEQQRGFVQSLMTSTASFASNVVNFCSELEEFWSFAYLLRGMSERLQHCCVKYLLPLMDLPSVKQTRARQLYNAGYKSLVLIAKADPNDLMERIDYLSRRGANQLIAAAKLLLLERVENLKEEAEDVMDGVAPHLLNQTVMK